MKPADWIANQCTDDAVVVFNKAGLPVGRALVAPIEKERTEFIEGSALDLTASKLYTIHDDVVLNPILDEQRTALQITDNDAPPEVINIMPFIGTDFRVIPQYKEVKVADVDVFYFRNDDGKIVQTNLFDLWILEPLTYYILETVETVNIPQHISARVDLRTSLFRAGMLGATSWAHPNYQGNIHVGLFNALPIRTFLQRGARSVSLHFFEFDIPTSVSISLDTSPRDIDLMIARQSAKLTHSYKGQWQGEHGSTDGKSVRPY